MYGPRLFGGVALVVFVLSALDGRSQEVASVAEPVVGYRIAADTESVYLEPGERRVDELGVKLDAAGNPALCHPYAGACGWLGADEAVFSAEVLVGALATVRVWTLADVPPERLIRLDGSPCGPDGDCGLGTGYLVLLLDPAGRVAAGRVELGLEDYTPHFSQARVLAAPGAAASLLWLETHSFCGGGCVRYAWRELRLRPEAGEAALSVRSGPYRTGVADVDDPIEGPDGPLPACTLTRRAAPAYDEATGRLTLAHDFELVDDTGSLETIVYAADGTRVAVETAPADAAALPEVEEVCEELE